jgi:hypothetical protein
VDPNSQMRSQCSQHTEYDLQESAEETQVSHVWAPGPQTLWIINHGYVVDCYTEWKTIITGAGKLLVLGFTICRKSMPPGLGKASPVSHWCISNESQSVECSSPFRFPESYISVEGSKSDIMFTHFTSQKPCKLTKISQT